MTGSQLCRKDHLLELESSVEGLSPSSWPHRQREGEREMLEEGVPWSFATHRLPSCSPTNHRQGEAKEPEGLWMWSMQTTPQAEILAEKGEDR